MKKITVILITVVFFALTSKAQINEIETDVASVSLTEAMISIYTDGEAPFYCQILYGTNSANEYVSDLYYLDPNCTWYIILEDLNPSTGYMYQVRVTWNDGYMLSEIGTFTTLECQSATFDVYDNTCTSELVVSSYFDPTYHIQWYKDGSEIYGANDSDYEVTTSGSYAVNIQNEECASFSGYTDVEVTGVQLQIISPTDICQFQTANVSVVGNAISYHWEPAEIFNDPNSSSTTMSINSSTAITVTGSFDECQTTETVFITVRPRPQVSIISEDSICASSNELIYLFGQPEGGTFLGQAVFDNYFDVSQVIGAGHYDVEYEYTDQYGCTGDNVTTIVVTEELRIDEILSKNGNLLIQGYFPNAVKMLIGDMVYYPSMQKTNEVVFQSFVPADGDYITVQAVGTNGCFETHEFHFGLGEEELLVDQIKMFPNPFKDEMKVEIPNGIYVIEILDLQGRVIRRQSADGNFEVHRDNLKSGIYSLRIISDKNIKTAKFQVIN